MTAQEAVNALIWPGLLGTLLSCTAREVPTELGPTLLVTIRFSVPGSKSPARELALVLPTSVSVHEAAREVCQAGAWLLGSEAFYSASLDGIERIWAPSEEGGLTDDTEGITPSGLGLVLELPR